MHVILEGIAQYDIRLALSHWIVNGIFTLAEFNQVLLGFNFGYSEKKNKPENIHSSVFTNDCYKLKFNAENTKILCKVLPFLLELLGVDLKSREFQFLIQLLLIIQHVYSPVISTETIEYLKELIATYLSSFSDIYPESRLLPKHHYLVHIPNLIKVCGPPFRSNCIRFEAVYQCFKRIALQMNFKNIALSIARKFQENLLGEFIDNAEETDALFCSSFIQGPSKTLCALDVEHFVEMGLDHGTMYSLNWLTIYGQKFIKNQAVIAADADCETEFPVFGILHQIILNNKKFYFVCSTLFTVRFYPQTLSYEVENYGGDKEKQLYDPSKLLDENIYHLVTSKSGKLFVPIKYYLSDIISEHLTGNNPLHCI